MVFGLQRGIWSGAIGMLGAAMTQLMPDQILIGATLLAFAVLLAISGITVNGLPWWHKRPGTPKFSALWWPPNYRDGDEVAGVVWQQGYSHIRMTLQNPTNHDYHNFDATVCMDQPIIKARARSEFGEVQIGAPSTPHSSMVIKGFDEDGEPSQMFVDMGGPNGFSICPVYRIRSALVPRGTKIVADFFTVSDVGGERLFSLQPEPPKTVEIHAHYDVLGILKTVTARIDAPLAQDGN